MIKKGDWGERFVLVNGFHGATTNDGYPSKRLLVLDSWLKLRIFEKRVPKKVATRMAHVSRKGDLISKLFYGKAGRNSSFPLIDS